MKTEKKLFEVISKNKRASKKLTPLLTNPLNSTTKLGENEDLAKLFFVAAYLNKNIVVVLIAKANLFPFETYLK